MIVWGGTSLAATGLGDGARYDPRTNSWTPVSPTGAPSARYRHTAVWTGREMIIWGGLVPNPPGNAIPQNDGARYDPRTDTWASLTTSNAPSARGNHTAVWDGAAMVVWGGGQPATNTGARYSPFTDTWSAMSLLNAPAGRVFHSALWTGGEMIIWGGQDTPGAMLTGGRYSPGTDTWSATSTAGCPSARFSHVGVWTGRYAAVWGGIDGSFGNGHTNTGGTYGEDPSAPLAGAVRDGSGTDLIVQIDSTTISGNWSGFADPESGIAKYEWAIGSSPGGTDVQPFVNVGSATSATASGLSLQVGRTYYLTVQATNAEGLATTVSSDGVFIGDSQTAKAGCAAATSVLGSAEALVMLALASILLSLGQARARGRIH